MVSERKHQKFCPWMETIRCSILELGSFVTRIGRDDDAVHVAPRQVQSHRATEGKSNKLKALKRGIYVRGVLPCCDMCGDV